jgi:hypothetical protein
MWGSVINGEKGHLYGGTASMGGKDIYVGANGINGWKGHLCGGTSSMGRQDIYVGERHQWVKGDQWAGVYGLANPLGLHIQ